MSTLLRWAFQLIDPSDFSRWLAAGRGDAQEGDRGVVHDAVLAEHLVQAHGLDGGEVHLAEHLVVVVLDTTERHDQTALPDGTSTPLGPARLVQVGGSLLDVLGREAGLPAGERLLQGNDPEGGVECSAVIPGLLEEDDVGGERRVGRRADVLVLGLPRDRGVQDHQVTLLPLHDAAVHGGLDGGPDDLECLAAEIFIQSNKHLLTP